MSKKHELWLENPPAGTSVCGGFDGSENDDFTCFKLETLSGFIFTPRYGYDQRPTIWNPKEWGGRIPRGEVIAAMDELAHKYKFVRIYCDPGFKDEMSWESQIDAWARAHGERVFVPWVMNGSNRITAVYKALRRFEEDLSTHRITHDGCPITNAHIVNARRIPKTAERYGLGKPQQDRKIDAAVATILAHEAACDARMDGWGEEKRNLIYSPSNARRLR